MRQNPDDFAVNQKTERRVYLEVAHCCLSAAWQLWDTQLASKGSRGGEQMEAFQFSPLPPHQWSVDDG